MIKKSRNGRWKVALFLLYFLGDVVYICYLCRRAPLSATTTMDKIDLISNLKRYFGFSSFKGQQEDVINNLLGGNDTFVLMPTGGGKSLCYQLPALIMDGTAIVLSPLIALMKNQVDAIRQVSENDGIAHYLNSSLTRAQVDEVKNDIQAGSTKLLYVAPESLTKEETKDFLRNIKVSFYAVDEAHCISEWGHDFRPEYRRIRPIVNEIGRAPIIALTATATDKVRRDIKKSLGILKATDFVSSFNRPNLYYEVRPKTKDVDKDIVRFIMQHPGKSGIVYCLSRKKVEQLAEILRANNINARAYHAGMETSERNQTQDDFIMERLDVIVATIAFGMGIDKPDVRFVIHYDIPKSLEGYYQETGRAGRDGGEGICLAFYSPKDLVKLKKFMEGKPVAEQDIGNQLLAETKAYVESGVCRRRLLLHYFGEHYPEDNCHRCDNCLHPHEFIEGSKDLLKVLNVIQAVKGKFKVDHIVNIMMGVETEEIISHCHEQLPEFAVGMSHESSYWQALVKQGILSGYIEKEVENYGLLKLTKSGKKFMTSPEPFYFKENTEFGDYEPEPEEGTAVLDEPLLKMLRDLRRKRAQALGIPPYVIFQDSSMEAMATMYPISLEELQNIPGVGQGKAQRYGKEFCELIKRHCEDNEIERPLDLRVRTVASKSKLKVSIIQKVDRKLDLEDIADGLGIEFDELLDEMEAIVYSGTKLDINYYLEDVMDEDYMLDIYDYFHDESETDRLSVAVKTLGPDYEERDIRLVRIKFLSELAN